MKTRIAAAVAAALLAVTLTGCGEDTTAQDTEKRSFAQSAEQTPEASTPPLVADPTPAALSDEDAEAAYLLEVRDRLTKIRTQIPDVTDEQLLAAAQDACDRLAAGESGENMTLIEGETTTNGYYMDSGAIIISARLTMCPIEG